MSRNAENRKAAEQANADEWESTPDYEKVAVRKALAAYQGSPGNSINNAMLRGCREYARLMNAAAGTIRAPK